MRFSTLSIAAVAIVTLTFSPLSFSQEGVEALDEVNAVRAARGLQPFAKDDGLTQAARGAASYRALNGIAGHTPNDFAYVPPGSSANAAGCAAWPPSFGWGSCCTYESWSHAGAAYAIGRDGQRYMHIFVRGVGTSVAVVTTGSTATQVRITTSPSPRRWFYRRR